MHIHGATSLSIIAFAERHPKLGYGFDSRFFVVSLTIDGWIFGRTSGIPRRFVLQGRMTSQRMLPGNRGKQSMNDVRQNKGCLAATVWKTDAVSWSKICIHRESFTFSVPDHISTAMFISIHWMEISLQNFFPFLQKFFCERLH